MLNKDDPDDDNDGIPDKEDDTPFGDPTGGGGFDSTTLCPDKEIPPEDPPEEGWGLRTIGFWKHQLRTALGFNGHQHVLTAYLVAYLEEIDELSDIPEYDDMDLADALALLELRGKQTMYARGVQQLLATYLNLVSDGDQMVDTDGDGITDMMLSDAIEDIESELLDPDGDHEWAKDTADIINNSGDE
jgi:hypothetical protein